MKLLDYDLNIIKERKKYAPIPELVTPLLESDNRIFEISCKSGSGKTFLLNLIAYALEADKLGDEYILPSLKESLSRYNNEDYCELNYKINLRLPDSRLLILEKEANQKEKLIQYENQPPINYYSLHQKVTVLYDVPSNPRERLDGVIKDLGIWNESISNKIKKHTEYLNELKRDFSNERNEEKIVKYKTELDKIKLHIDSIESTLENRNTKLKNLETLQNLIRLQEIIKKVSTLESKIIKLKDEIRNFSRPSGSLRDQRKLNSLQSEFERENRIYKSRISELFELISSKQELNEYINNTQILKTTYKSILKYTCFEIVYEDSDYYEQISKIIDNLKYFKNSIYNFIRQEKTGKKYKLNESLNELVEVVDKFKETDSISVFERITNLSEEEFRVRINKLLSENVIVDYNEVASFIKAYYDDIWKSLEQSRRINREIIKESNKRQVESSEIKYNSLNANLKADNLEKDSLLNEKEMLKNFCFAAMDISDISRLEKLEYLNDYVFIFKQKIPSEDLIDITSSIETLKKDIQEKSIDIDKHRKQKNHIEIRLEQEESRNPGQYSDSEKENINKFIRYLQMTTSNLIAFNDIIKDINKGDLSKYEKLEDKRFMEIAGRVIAYSMGNKLLTINGEYIGLNSYNLLERSFSCENDIIIHRDDLSTGLSSANYLKQRIDNVKGDYVVILLDEIGNMSSDILKELLESIKVLEKQNRLILALLTHPSTQNITIIPH